MVVHVFGNAVDFTRLHSVCKKNNIKIIEDAAESLGTFYTKGKFKGRHSGLIGDIGCISFNGNKIITHKGGNMYDDVLPKWKIGLYKTAFEKETSDVDRRIIFFDNIRVGNEKATYNQMRPDR